MTPSREGGESQSESGESQSESGDDGEVFMGINGSQNRGSDDDEGVGFGKRESSHWQES